MTEPTTVICPHWSDRCPFFPQVEVRCATCPAILALERYRAANGDICVCPECAMAMIRDGGLEHVPAWAVELVRRTVERRRMLAVIAGKGSLC